MLANLFLAEIADVVRSIRPEGLERFLALGMLGIQADFADARSNLGGIVDDDLLCFRTTEIRNSSSISSVVLKYSGG